MEVGAGDIDGRHFCVGYDDAFAIAVVVELAVHGQTGAGCGRGDQLNDGLVADQRFGTPVLANEREQAVLNLVPLAGAGWEVTNDDVEPDLVREPLQFALPQAHARANAAAAIGGLKLTRFRGHRNICV